MKSYKKLVAGIVSAWFAVALAASALGIFKNDANRVGLAVALAAVTPIVAFGLWYATSERFKAFVLSADAQTLTAVQTLGVIGVVFVVLQARNVLPAMFALPAGYGDIFIGATATLAAWKLGEPQRRNGECWFCLSFNDTAGIREWQVTVGKFA